MGTIENFENLDKLENEVNEIFAQVSINNELSLEELNNLMSINNELKKKYINETQAKGSRLAEEYAKLVKKRKNNSLIIMLSLVNLIISATLPLLSLLTTTILILIFKKFMRNCKSIDENIEKIDKGYKELNSRIDTFFTTLRNNETFIFKYQKKHYAKKVDELVKDNLGCEKLTKAAKIIENFIDNGILPTEMDEETKALVKNMLQKDLNVNINDFNELLYYAQTIASEKQDLKKSVPTLSLTKKIK